MNPDEDARRSSFERLAAEVVEPVRRFLARRTDPVTAEDVLADVLLVLWRRLDAVPAEPLPWTYGVARNCLANAERGARRQRRLAARIAAVDRGQESGPEDPGTDQLVLDALARLRPADAELLRLWAWEQLTPAEIAEIAQITPNAANIRLHRARGRLRDQLRKSGDGPGHEPMNEGSTT